MKETDQGILFQSLPEAGMNGLLVAFQVNFQNLGNFQGFYTATYSTSLILCNKNFLWSPFTVTPHPPQKILHIFLTILEWGSLAVKSEVIWQC